MIYSASENWTGTANGAEIAFGTTPNGPISRAERMKITNNGRVGIATSTPLAPLHLSIGSNISLGQPALIIGEAINTGGIAQGQHLEFDRLGIQAGSGFPASANLVNTLSLNSQGGSVTVNNQPVATGEEDLRIVRGGVTGAGVRDKGVGFTSARSSTGIYVISFTTSFSDIPSITGSVRQNTDFIVSVGTITANGATIFVNNVSNVNVDAPVYFIIAGPR